MKKVDDFSDSDTKKKTKGVRKNHRECEGF